MQANNLSVAKRWIQAARRWPENLGSGKPYPANVDERLEDWLASLCDTPFEFLPDVENVLKITGGSQSVLVKKILAELQRQVTKEPVLEALEPENETQESEYEVPEGESEPQT
jgi:hypothetical protein